MLIDLLVALLLVADIVVAAIVVALVVVVVDDDDDDIDVATEFLTQEVLYGTSHFSCFNEKSASNQAPTKCRLQNQVDQWMYGRVHICSGRCLGHDHRNLL